MLHMLATLLTLVLMLGAGGVIAASLADRFGAIEAALGLSTRREMIRVAQRRTRVRWYTVRTVSMAPVRARSAA